MVKINKQKLESVKEFKLKCPKLPTFLEDWISSKSLFFLKVLNKTKKVLSLVNKLAEAIHFLVSQHIQLQQPWCQIKKTCRS